MTNQSTIKIQDYFNHSENLKTDIYRLQIELNQIQHLVYATNHFIKKVNLMETIVKSYDSYNLKFIYNEINRLLIKDPELHGVLITIKKNMHLENFNYEKVGQIYHRI
uniref:hypothetical protein n=1 Tax=Flavobacterium sp. TaxID=239 RepID=UPI00404B07F2